VGLIPSQVAIR